MTTKVYDNQGRLKVSAYAIDVSFDIAGTTIIVTTNVQGALEDVDAELVSIDARLTPLESLDAMIPNTATQGDILYASASNVYSTLAKSTATSRALINNGTNNNPAWSQVSLTTCVTGTLPIGNGGTGQTTAQAAIDGLLPTQSGNSGKFLTTNGTTCSWGAQTGQTYVGYVGSDGSTGNRLPSGFSVSKVTTGTYDVTTGLSLADATRLAVMVTVFASSGNKNAYIDVTNTTGNVFRVITIDPGTGTTSDQAFTFIAAQT